MWSLALALTGCTGALGPVDTGSGGLVLSSLGVIPIDENPLACWLVWRTNEPTDSHVEFQSRTTPRLRTGSAELATEHQVLVYGLRPDADYELQAISETSDGDRVTATPTVFTSGSLPDHVPVPEVLVHDPELARAGYTLFDNYRYSVGAPNTAVIVDMEGFPVWLHQFESGDDLGAMDVRLTRDGTVLMGASVPSGERPREVDLAGRILWEGPEQPGFESDDFMHHTTEILDDDSVITLVKRFVDGTRGDRIVIYDRAGQETWSWDTFDHLEVQWVDDWTHANSVTVDGDEITLSLRNLDQVLRLSRSTKAVQWRLGPGGDFTLDGDWFESQHAPKPLGDDRLLIYDNGTERRTTRVIEMALDTHAGTAEIVWEWPMQKEHGWFTGYWGDADRLDNGNTLIAAGASQVNRMTEVTADGQIAWQAQWPTAGQLVVGFYRAQRIDLPGLEVVSP